MRFMLRSGARLGVPLLLGLCTAGHAHAQAAPKVATRPILVEGIAADPRTEDLLGIARLGFQGVIASELASIGYRVTGAVASGASPLVLSGTLTEETCDDIAQTQCRIAIRWELQETNGLVVYRVVTRAVDEQVTIDKRRRALVLAALHSLAMRRRFAMRLVDPDARSTDAPRGRLGFKRCQREGKQLPEGARAAAAALVLVESGSRLTRGTLVSSDGLVMASASVITSNAPLRVRFAGHQVLSASVVAQSKEAGLVLLHVSSSSTASCLPVRDEPLNRGDAVFGVSSELAEDAAVSLARSVVQGESASAQGHLAEADARIAREIGAPLLDELGRVAAVVTHVSATSTSQALSVVDGLRALGVEPAPITDPRLLGPPEGDSRPLGFVRDADDPAFALTERYTYGSGSTARLLRNAGAVTAGIGAAGVAYTWLRFGGGSVSPSEHDKLVIWNDVSWAVLGLGVAGFGASFVWPQRHEVVDARAARGEVVLGVTASGVTVRGAL